MTLTDFQDTVARLAHGRTHKAAVERWYYANTQRQETIYLASVFSERDDQRIFGACAETPELVCAKLLEKMAAKGEV